MSGSSDGRSRYILTRINRICLKKDKIDGDRPVSPGPALDQDDLPAPSLRAITTYPLLCCRNISAMAVRSLHMQSLVTCKFMRWHKNMKRDVFIMSGLVNGVYEDH